MLRRILFIIGITLIALTFVGCDEDPPKETEAVYYKIYRENGDNSFTVWTITEAPTIKGTFLCWRAAGTTHNMCISGSITMMPVIVEKPKVIAKEGKEKK